MTDTVGVPFHDTRSGVVTTRQVSDHLPRVYVEREYAPTVWESLRHRSEMQQGVRGVEVVWHLQVRCAPSEQCTPVQLFYLLHSVGS